MEILDKLTSAHDIKNMSIQDLYKLCEDLRLFMLENISKTGGHLASNLGVVEITVAIHNVFDTSKDRLIFDVGHQCYVHKILTGRKDCFDALRSNGGISGFPNPEESLHDAFISGHASTSVSVALGMARARTALGDDYSVIALMGDGAMTGGLAFEALSDAGLSEEPLIVILNDNEMSITENVGGVSRHLAYLRMRPYYLSVKKVYRKTIAKVPLLGSGLTRLLRAIKTGIKNAVKLPSSMFESMGFVYIGPVDGHNIKETCRLLKVAKNMEKPVLIHLKTIKGKGYKYAEENPDIYHGVQSFDVKNGIPAESAAESFGNTFGKTLTKLAAENSRIYAITAAMQNGTGLDEFAAAYPERFYDVGIAESHAVTMAGAMAKQGLIPVCAIYSTFIQRAYDMLFHDVCLMKQHVIFMVDRAGFVADDGQTHQGIYDIGMFLQMPEMTVLCPSSLTEMEEMLRYAVNDVKGPVAVRYPRGGSGCEIKTTPPYEPKLIKQGKDITLISYGRTVQNIIEASNMLKEQGIDASVIKLTDISNFKLQITETGDAVMFGENNTQIPLSKKIYIVEECVNAGSAASKIALQLSPASCCIYPINLGSKVPPPASIEELMEMYGLDAKGIAEFIHP